MTLTLNSAMESAYLIDLSLALGHSPVLGSVRWVVLGSGMEVPLREALGYLAEQAKALGLVMEVA